VGTRAAYGDSGEQVARHLADRLGLSSPDLPWHTDRQRVLDLGFALTGVAAAVGKLATDVALLAATEVGELRLSSAGGSSSMPHKRNPTPAVLARSGALRAPGLLATLVAAASTPEHERATGAWHAEWQPWRELLDVVGGMVAHSESMLTSLEADEAAMRSNLDATGGVVMAASVAARLAPAIGHNAAETLVTTCAAQVSPTLSFADVLGADPAITDALSRDELAAALDPIRWLGSASEMVDRAVERHTQRRAGASSS
jgi:3-carboxy-cis,cis-muconate cycloisomerase